MPNLYDFTRLYRRTVTGVGVEDGTQRLELGRLGARKIRVLTHVTVEDKTNDLDLCRLGIISSGRDHYIDELTDPLEDELMVSRSDILLGEGDIFFAELTGQDNGDKLVMTAIGWEIDL